MCVCRRRGGVCVGEESKERLASVCVCRSRVSGKASEGVAEKSLRKG